MKTVIFVVVALIVIIGGVLIWRTTKKRDKGVGMRGGEELSLYKCKKEVELKPEVIASLQDSFEFVVSCDFHNDYLAVLDGSLNRCYVYVSYKLKTQLGAPGSGPGEFNLMKNGSVRFDEENDIAVFDPMNAKVHLFSMEGNFLNSISIGNPSSDFGISKDYIFFTPIMGEDDIVVLKREDGKTLKTFKSSRDLNPLNADFPFPLRRMEITRNGKVFVVITDIYKISEYSLAEGKELSFGVKTKPIPIDEKTKKIWIEKSPMLKGKIKKFYSPLADIFMDREKGVLWVWVFSKDEKGFVFDLFDETGNYLNRIRLKDVKGNPAAVNKARMAFFDPESLKVNIYDVSSLY